ncbi:hypothetical protein [Streptomyces fragilis]|uniref:Aldo/keto reductase n=1 Tax=Streptomyces fragilis TaxID=67301 RepID=A0ABV2YP50_9ACTN|nr:hypothetical protein [Streptomyces fragilis]
MARSAGPQGWAHDGRPAPAGHLEENVAAGALRLTAAQRERLDRAAPVI